MDLPARQPLSKWEKMGVAAFVLFLIAFGCLVELRSAFLTRRMGDLDVFLRAAWAVRVDADPYEVASENGWHYLYPPLYAILLMPLADPPPGFDQAGYVPYAWSVAICYVLSLVCLFWGAHVLACALEAQADDAEIRSQPRFCRRWWVLRCWPILICWLPIGHTMSRGQANVFVLGFLCAALAGWIRGWNFRAGAWLALAICIKVIPAYLLIYPLWKRDVRGLMGCAAGLLIGLVVVPCVVSGPAKTVVHYETYAKVFFAPFFQINDDDSRKDEILGGVNATESIGVRNALFNWAYPDPAHRPRDLPAAGKAAYLLLGVAMTLLTLWPGKATRGGKGGRHVGHPFAALILLMAIFSPVCHSHYLAFCLPIVMCMLASHWHFQATVRLPGIWTAIFAIFFVTTAVAYLPELEILKDRCAALFVTLPLWCIPVVQLWREARRDASAKDLPQAPNSQIAA